VWTNGLRRAGLRHRGAHVLRHSCATYIVLSGGTAFDVKEQLGHATSAQGEEYVAEFGNARAVERSAKVAAYYRREIAPEAAVELPALPFEVPVETPPLYR
jgi:integrase